MLEHLYISRTGENLDYLNECNLDKFVAFDVEDIPKCTSQDKVTNVFGKRLLQLCKETGLYPGFESHSCFYIYLYLKNYSHVAYQSFKCLDSIV